MKVIDIEKNENLYCITIYGHSKLVRIDKNYKLRVTVIQDSIIVSDIAENSGGHYIIERNMQEFAISELLKHNHFKLRHLTKPYKIHYESIINIV